jgi:hypothetical protein
LKQAYKPQNESNGKCGFGIGRPVPEVWKQGLDNGIHRLERASEQGAYTAPISSFDLCSVQTKYLAS